WGGTAPRVERIDQYGAYQGWWAATGHPLGPQDWAASRALLKGETSLSEVIDILRFDGTRGTILSSAAPLRDASGAISGAVAVIQDITAQRNAEKALRDAFSNTVVENIPDMIFVKSAKDLRFVQFNKAGEELLGYSREEMIGKNDYDFFPKAEADVFTAQDREVLVGGKVLELPENVITTRNRGLRYLHSKKIPLYDSAGKPQYLLGISEDITERKQAEEVRMQLIREQAAAAESAKEKKRWEFLAEAGRVLAESLDYSTTLKNLASLAATRFSSWCVVLNRDLKELAIAADNPQVIPRARAVLNQVPIDPGGNMPSAVVLRTGKSVLIPRVSETELERFAPSGIYREFFREFGFNASICVPLVIRGEIEGTITVSSLNPKQAFDQADLDLVEEFARRAASALDNARLFSEAQKAIQLREDFMSVASHELRTPLTPLKMQLQLLSKAIQTEVITTSPKARDLVRLLKLSEAHIQRLTRLVEDMLEVSRINAGGLRLHPEKVDLSQLVLEVVDRFRAEIVAAKCELQIQADEGIQGEWDRLRIEQVVINLLTNAIKYGAGRPIRISVTRSGDCALLTVQDFGIGIAEEDQTRIFNRFERAVSIRRFGGIGLGLYIARQGVEAHHGEIRVLSTPGQGATFIVQLPLAFAKPNAA
ncbi:MAG: PAS domain-containing protein, partial [Bdellovibrionota bacterium]